MGKFLVGVVVAMMLVGCGGEGGTEVSDPEDGAAGAGGLATGGAGGFAGIGGSGGVGGIPHEDPPKPWAVQDFDEDGVLNGIDNCPQDFNPCQDTLRWCWGPGGRVAIGSACDCVDEDCRALDRSWCGQNNPHQIFDCSEANDMCGRINTSNLCDG